MKKYFIAICLSFSLFVSPILADGWSIASLVYDVCKDISGANSDQTRIRCWSKYDESRDKTFLRCGDCTYLHGKKKGVFDGFCYFDK